jgi:16S rRNA (uracil1498-N3)-methyltransferase
MNVFLAIEFYDGKALLQEDEAYHCFKVLRRSQGDPIQLIDGKGNFLSGRILEIDKRHCEVEILESWKEEKADYKLHLAVAPTKNISRYEWFIEKSIEIGVDRITPIICDHSERNKLNLPRLQKVALSAVKQSLSASIPVLDEPIQLKKFILEQSVQVHKIVAHLEDQSLHLKKIVEPNNNYLIVVGPEGDFSAGELDLFRENNWKFGILGMKRLRTETAAIVAAEIINSIHF